MFIAAFSSKAPSPVRAACLYLSLQNVKKTKLTMGRFGTGVPTRYWEGTPGLKKIQIVAKLNNPEENTCSIR